MSRLLPKWYPEEILNGYSFVHDSYIKGIYLYIEYIVDGKKITKKIARRTTVEQLQKILQNIKKEVGEKNNEGYRGNYYIT